MAASSPPRSPRRQPYYVQSPSRDSHDGEKTTTSFHSTPIISPAGSPPHSHSSVGRHSRESSSSRFSGSLKPGSRKISPNDAVSGGRRKGERKEWKDFDVIEEEGLLDDEEARRGGRRRCYLLAFVVGFFSITFENLLVQAGSDYTGVATEMISMNSTVKLIFRNTATFFGVHVSSTPVDLAYYQITIGSGTIKKFYQSRKSQRLVSVSVTGDKIPLYGSGASLSSSSGMTTLPVPLKLNFVVRSRGNVLGKLVSPKFRKEIECSINYDQKNLNVPISLKNSCTYD
ncbi:hypothetical protein RHGRI_021855 [Rhododendron griersonianum]|uniref:Late embryogenesis abundant protein LEA-2 subgroup domain-containing protein n=1 Tax=Rhododendron griersonianum TaxID=479676 RepID=A0AAV6JRM0_9ERIC|nr:hypothetical protein RHGRI_021855 [Rhododendron griersonianum]